MMHTPTPWRIRHYMSGRLDCIQGNPEGGEQYGREIANRMARPASQRAENDARRIVACVNALEGFDIAAIEAGAVADMQRCLQWIVDHPTAHTGNIIGVAKEGLAKIAPAQELQEQG
jgi:hypothetical protein